MERAVNLLGRLLLETVSVDSTWTCCFLFTVKLKILTIKIKGCLWQGGPKDDLQEMTHSPRWLHLGDGVRPLGCLPHQPPLKPAEPPPCPPGSGPRCPHPPLSSPGPTPGTGAWSSHSGWVGCPCRRSQRVVHVQSLLRRDWLPGPRPWHSLCTTPEPNTHAGTHACTGAYALISGPEYSLPAEDGSLKPP